MNPLIKYFAVALASFGVTYLMTPLLGRLALRLGFVDEPGERRIHSGRIPRAGGVAVLLGFHAGCLVLFLVPWEGFSATIDAGWYRGILLPGLLLLITGLWDDRWGLPPLVKLEGQMLAGLLAWGAGLRFGAMLGWDLPPVPDALVTTLWCVGFMNAFNLIDGLDGLATGLGTLAALGLAGASLIRGAPGDTLVLLALAGSCLAFLRYNFHPARVFLGDTGSLFIGFTLAAVSLGTHTKGIVIVTLGVPLLAAGIPILDTALAIWRRGLRHRPLVDPSATGPNGVMDADTEHLHHRLLARLGSQPRVAGALYAANALLIGVALLSVMFSRSVLFFYLVLLIGGTYVIIRHLAHVELWRSGQWLARGLRRPPRRVISILLYPLLDLSLLSLAYLTATIAVGGGLSVPALKVQMLGDGILWVSLPFVAMTVARVYQRVWSRASLLDYAGLAFAIILGVTAAATIQALHLDGSGPYGRFARTLVYAGVALPLCATLRLLPRTLLDLSAGNDSARAAAKAAPERVLLYGAGYGCMLYLRARACSLDLGRPPVIVGIVDDDENLKGRLLSGHRILGVLEEVPAILERHGVAKVIATTALHPATYQRLVPVLRERGIPLLQWSVGLTPLFTPDSSESSSPAVSPTAVQRHDTAEGSRLSSQPDQASAGTT